MTPESIPIKIATLTSVSIGNGKVLSPLSDYIVEIADKQAWAVLINHKLVEKALEQQPHFINQYVDGIKNGIDVTRTRSNFDLQSFLTKDLRIKLSDFQRRLLFESIPDLQERIQIHQTIRNGLQPYIPGSSIKGAFKTAILYKWLTESDTGKTKLSNLIKMIGKTGSNDRRGVEDLDRAFEQTFDTLFGQPTDNDFVNLQVSDTNCLDIAQLMIRHTGRLSFKEGAYIMPQYREVIKGGSVLDASLKIRPHFRHDDLQWLNTQDALSSLFQCINTFSLHNMEFEKAHLSKFEEIIADKNVKIYDQLLKAYNDLQGRLEAATGKAIFRVGFGKSYFYNSIGTAIYRSDPDAFQYLRRLLGVGKNNQINFPATMLMLTRQNLPMGWVALSHKTNLKV